MKCPKCGYNSFEFYDVCKKCSNDLKGFKGTFGIKSIVLPQQARATMAKSLMAAAAVSDHTEEAAETASDMFSFDLPEEETAAAAAAPLNDPFSFASSPEDPSAGFGEFSFDEEPAATKGEEDVFANLLESTSLGEDDPFAATAKPGAIPAAGTAPASTAGEFDLENFSWDEPAATTVSGEKKSPDDFTSLFGDGDHTKK